MASALERMGIAGKIIVCIAFSAMVMVVYFVVFFTEIDGQIAQARSKETQLSGELNRAQQAKDAYQKDLEEKTRRQAFLREQKKVLPDDPEMPSFLASVQNVATASGIALTSYSPEDEVIQQYYAKVPMALSMKGRFHQIGRFFYGMSRLDRVINIEDIEIKADKKSASSEEVVVEVKCLATAFRAAKTGETPSAGTGGRRRR